MSETEAASDVPRRVLLATDLSARCDRALDRAAELCRTWKAPLVAVHALEQADDFYAAELERRLPSWRRSPGPAKIAEDQLRHDIGEAAGSLSAIVERGDPADVIVRAAEVANCDLIVTGIARDETLGRFWLGGTVEQVVRRARVPVLVARQRVRGPYRHVVVATDFSDWSRGALRAALRLFPLAAQSLFHAYEVPMRGRMGDPAALDAEFAKIAHEDCARFLEQSDLPAARVERLRRLIEPGSPRDLIGRYVRDKQVDLVVLGTHGRTPLLDVLMGSVAREIFSSLPCDALLVRDPRPPKERRNG